jgi:hypothetical protein
VKEYFIELRKFVMRYEKIFNQSIETHKLLRSELMEDYDFIYFFAVDKSNKDIVKLGTTSNLIARINTYNTGRLDDIDLKYASVVYNGKLIEDCIKKSEIIKKSQHRPNKEIYNISENILLNIINTCYNKCTTNNQHEQIYKDIATILDMCDFINKNKHLVPYVIISS